MSPTAVKRGAGGASSTASTTQSSQTSQTSSTSEPLYPWCSDELDIDTSNLCDEKTVELGSARPNLYFVLDTSGSMAGRIDDTQTDTLLDASRQAIYDLIDELGETLNYGIATFPGDLAPEDLGCAMGEELIAPLSDDAYCETTGVAFRFKRDFKEKLSQLVPMGGTPLSPTLRNLEPKLAELKGPTTVILLTDGAPNCNVEASCEQDECLLPQDFFNCGPSGNCCSAEAQSDDNPNPGSWCIDTTSSVGVVADLAAKGIETRVIGIPGAQEYEPVMNALAKAGGGARESDSGEESSYFDVADAEELLDALRTIGQSAASNCSIELDRAPSDANLVNVYVNNRLINEDADDGWELEGTTITLKGDSCLLLREGGERNLRVVVGCPTIIR